MAVTYIKMRATRSVLNYRENKPTMYRLRQMSYPPIKEDELIKYISNSAHVPESTIKAAVAAIGEAISYFAINGHRVVIDGFGGFYLNVNTKWFDKNKPSANSKELALDNFDIKKCVYRSALRFVPGARLQSIVSATGTNIVTSGEFKAEN